MINLSLFLNINGFIKLMFVIIIINTVIKIISLMIKVGFSLIISVFFMIPIGLFDLFL